MGSSWNAHIEVHVRFSFKYGLGQLRYKYKYVYWYILIEYDILQEIKDNPLKSFKRMDKYSKILLKMLTI